MTLTKAHRLALFAIAAWGFVALLVTGDFSPVLIGLCCGLVVAAYLAPSNPSSLRIILWNVLTAVVFVGILLIAKQSLLDATVYFFMYLQIAKLFTLRKSSDILWVYVISFFHVIGTAVLTTSLAFAAVFLIYVALMALSMTLFTVHREYASGHWYENSATPAGRVARDAAFVFDPEDNLRHDSRATPFLTRRFILGSGFLSLFIVVTSLAFFMVIPRLSTQSLFRTDFGQPVPMESTSAFSETVDFGAFQRIHLDSSVALYVEPLDKTPADYVRLRAVSLDNFDGQRWRRSMSQHLGQPFARFARRQVQYPQRRYRIIQPPGITKFVFAPTFPDDLQVELLAHVVFDAVSNSAWLPRMPSRELSYTVISKVEDLESRQDPAVLYPSDDRGSPDAAKATGSESDDNSSHVQTTRADGARALRDLVSSGRNYLQRSQRELQALANPRGEQRTVTQAARSVRSARRRYDSSDREWRPNLFRLPEPIRERYLQLPDRMDVARVSQLATAWTANSRTPFEKARSIERHLRTDYGYSLETRPAPKGNFVEQFLFASKQGHCEYFATSMAMMCRTLDIPSRIVNGFYATEWSNLSRVFTVRQKDAHSWVEVYFDNYGWMTFDPTPPAGINRASTNNLLVRSFQTLLNAARVRWYRHMIDYDYSSQLGIVRSVLRLTRRIGDTLDGLQPFASGSGASRLGLAGRRLGVLVVTLAFVALGIALIYAGFSLRRRTGKARAHAGARSHPTGLYAEVLRRLRNMGYIRKKSETPREFASRVARAPGLEPVGPITESYYGERFALTPLSREDRQLFEAFLQHLKYR